MNLEIIHFDLCVNFKTCISKNMIKITSVSLAKLSQVVFSGFKATAGEIKMLLKAEYWLLSKAEKNNKQTNESRFKIFLIYIIKCYFSISV